MSWIIESWTGRRLFPDRKFDTFEEGWDFIYQNVDNSVYNESQNDNDNVYQDLYVEEVS